MYRSNSNSHSSSSFSPNPIYFGLVLGSFLAIYVIVGSIANYWSYMNLNIIKKIADFYIIPNARLDIWSVCKQVGVGIFWAFCDGFLVGTSFFWLYQKLDHFIHAQ